MAHEEVIRTGEEFYCTFSHNTTFWQPTEEALLEMINVNLLVAHERFKAARWVMVSLGTSWVYRTIETQEVVANCHKLPARQFDRICLSVSASVAVLSGLAKMYPDKQFDNAHYFPAYEILLDELRDYRFYKEDMVHPTEQAVRHIWERFVDFAIDPKEKPAMKAAADLKQMLQHMPVFPESEAFKRFESLRVEKINEMKCDFPAVCIENLGD